MGRALKQFELKEFKKLANAGEDVAAATLTKSFSSDVKVVGTPNDRVRSFVVSDSSVDRDGDTVSPDGWVLEPFTKGGAVLWAHDGRLPPIAQPTKTFVENGKLIGQARFAPADMPHPMGEGFGHTVMRMFDEGLMRAVSAGFLPLEFVFSEERGGFMPTDFKKQELLEWSPVPVPSNRNALSQARGVGINIDSILAWAETERDAGSILVPKGTLQGMLDSVAGDKVLVEIKADEGGADDIDEDDLQSPELDPEQELLETEDEETEDEETEDDAPLAADSVEDSADASDSYSPVGASASQSPAEVYASAQETITKAEAALVDAAIEAIDALQLRGSMFSDENRRRLISSLDSIKEFLGFETKEVAPSFLVELIEEQAEEDDSGIDIDPIELRAAMDRILANKIYQITGKLPQ